MTSVTVNRNVSVMLKTVPLMVFVTVTVMVAVPFWFAAGVMLRVRVEPVPVITMLALGTRVVLLDVAVIESKAVAESPTLKLKGGSAVSSAVVLSVMSSTDGSASKAPMSTV